MKPEIPDTLPDSWLEFYIWAVEEADRLSGGTETQLINEEGEAI